MYEYIETEIRISWSPSTTVASLEKWTILGLGQDEYKISLEFLLVPELRKCLKKKKNKSMGACQKVTGTNL